MPYSDSLFDPRATTAPCRRGSGMWSAGSRENGKEGAMSPAVKLVSWRKWYCVLRHRKRFGVLESVRFGLWLARGSADPAKNRS